MEIIVILAIIFAVVNSVNKKKQAEQKRQAAQRQADVRSLEEDEARAAERLRDYQAERQRQQSRQAGTAAPVTRAAAQPGEGQGSAWRCACGTVNRGTARFCTACGKARYGGSMNYASSEGSGVSGEGSAAPGSLGTPVRQGKPRPAAASVTRHVVKPLTESAHRHVESSLTGIEDCHEAPERQVQERDAYATQNTETAQLPYGLAFGRDAAVQGMLYAEILGKPKALRRRGA